MIFKIEQILKLVKISANDSNLEYTEPNLSITMSSVFQVGPLVLGYFKVDDFIKLFKNLPQITPRKQEDLRA